MSWITIKEERHQCTVADLQRWDEAAASDGVTREEAAAKEINSISRALARKGRAEKQAEKEAAAHEVNLTQISKENE